MRSIASLLLALALGLSAAACSSGASEGFISSKEAHALVEGGAKLVDVRTPGEYKAGHVPGAVNIPLNALEARLAELPDKNAEIVVYCRSGRRSGIAQRLMQSKGYTKVHNLGPRTAW